VRERNRDNAEKNIFNLNLLRTQRERLEVRATG